MFSVVFTPAPFLCHPFPTQAASGRLGLPDPKLTLAQHKHGSSRRVVALARCALGHGGGHIPASLF